MFPKVLNSKNPTLCNDFTFYIYVFLICIMVIWNKLFIIHKILDFSKKFPDQNDLTIQFIPFKVVFSPIQSLDRHEYSFLTRIISFLLRWKVFHVWKSDSFQNVFVEMTFVILHFAYLRKVIKHEMLICRLPFS